MKKLVFAWLIFGLVPLSLVFAQETPTEPYTSPDGTITFMYPPGWVVEEDEAGVIFVKNSAALDVDSDTFAPGQIGIGILPPALMLEFGLPVDATPSKVLETIRPFAIDDGEVVSEIRQLEIGGHPAAQFDTEQGSASDTSAIAIGFEGGTILVAYQVAVGERAQSEPVILAILETLEYQSEDAEIRQWATTASATSEFGSTSWNAAQATGEPNSAECGDQSTAWASGTSTGVDALTVNFVQLVIPTQINIHQTYNPGSIVRVEIMNRTTGKTIEIPESADPVGNTDCPGVFTLDLENYKAAVDTVVIHVDQTIGGNWNEIDAVELVGIPTDGTIQQWASSAVATTEYTSTNWNAMQATGEPNSPQCADQSTAWASSSSTGVDALTVRFDEAVIPTQVDIYQSYNPGSIIRVDLLTASGETIMLPDSADPVGNTECPGVFTLNITDIKDPVNGVVIHLDQTIGGNWNEIDAVSLEGALPAGE